MITGERVPGTDPRAAELAAAMVTGLRGLYGPRVAGETPSATPEELSPPGGVFVLLRDGERVLAGGGVKRLAEGIGEIKRMYVVPDARSSGHARRLLAELESAAADLGYWRVRLDTGPEQHHARALYESAGYRSIADYNGNAYASYWGEKDLPAVVPARFNGPPQSGHGGYSSWVAARYLDAETVEVTLRMPPPLDSPMEVVRVDGTVELRQPAGEGAAPVLVAAPADLDGVEVPEALDVEAAHAARDPSLWAADVHPFPTCFACGPLHADGLHLHPGAAGDGRYATDWTPPAGCDAALVWSALDCPSWAPFMAAERQAPCVLARFAVTIASLPPAEPHTIVSVSQGIEGRKRTSVSALFSAGGELRALGRALWIELR